MKILVLDRFSAEATAWLKSHSGFEVTLATALAAPSVIERDFDAVILRSKTKVNESFLSSMPKLKAVVSATAGFDHIDLALCAARGVKVANCPDSHAASAAEHTWTLLLACARKLRAAEATARTQNWDREPLLGWQFEGKTHGIVGLGRIGSRVARVARAFGMHVVAHDPYRDNAWFAKHEAERVGVDELFHLADSVSIHVPLTRETNGRYNRIHLDFLKPHSIVVNTSRGGALKEADLLIHLKNKGPGTFGLDVFAQEPLKPGHDFGSYPQVVMTPHIGAATHEAFKAVSMEAARSVVGLLTNGAVSGPLPPREEWYQAVSDLAGTSPF